MKKLIQHTKCYLCPLWMSKGDKVSIVKLNNKLRVICNECQLKIKEGEE